MINDGRRNWSRNQDKKMIEKNEIREDFKFLIFPIFLNLEKMTCFPEKNVKWHYEKYSSRIGEMIEKKRKGKRVQCLVK